MPVGFGYEPMPGGPPPNLLTAAPPQPVAPQAPAPQPQVLSNGQTVTRNADGSVTYSLPVNQGEKTRGHGGYRTERHDYFAERAAKRAEAVELRNLLHPYTRPSGPRSRNVQVEDQPEEIFAPLIQNTPPQIARRAQNRRDSDLSRFIQRV